MSTPFPARGPLLAMFALPLLAACAGFPHPFAAASGDWHRAGADADDVALTRQECRAAVSAQLRSHLQLSRRETGGGDRPGADNLRHVDGATAIDRRFREARDARMSDRLMAACMRQRGYRRGPPGDQSA